MRHCHQAGTPMTRKEHYPYNQEIKTYNPGRAFATLLDASTLGKAAFCAAIGRQENVINSWRRSGVPDYKVAAAAALLDCHPGCISNDNSSRHPLCLPHPQWLHDALLANSTTINALLAALNKPDTLAIYWQQFGLPKFMIYPAARVLGCSPFDLMPPDTRQTQPAATLCRLMADKSMDDTALRLAIPVAQRIYLHSWWARGVPKDHAPAVAALLDCQPSDIEFRRENLAEKEINAETDRIAHRASRAWQRPEGIPIGIDDVATIEAIIAEHDQRTKPPTKKTDQARQSDTFDPDALFAGYAPALQEPPAAASNTHADHAAALDFAKGAVFEIPPTPPLPRPVPLVRWDSAIRLASSDSDTIGAEIGYACTAPGVDLPARCYALLMLRKEEDGATPGTPAPALIVRPINPGDCANVRSRLGHIIKITTPGAPVYVHATIQQNPTLAMAPSADLINAMEATLITSVGLLGPAHNYRLCDPFLHGEAIVLGEVVAEGYANVSHLTTR